MAISAGPLSQSAAATPSASSRYEADVQRYANAERTARRQPALRHSACLDRYAERQAQAMARSQRLYHQRLVPILENCRLSMVGENVAYGYRSGKAVTGGWMRSPGHRENLLNRDYRGIGVGAVRDRHGRWWVAQVFGR